MQRWSLKMFAGYHLHMWDWKGRTFPNVNFCSPFRARVKLIASKYKNIVAEDKLQKEQMTKIHHDKSQNEKIVLQDVSRRESEKHEKKPSRENENEKKKEKQKSNVKKKKKKEKISWAAVTAEVKDNISNWASQNHEQQKMAWLSFILMKLFLLSLVTEIKR